MQAGRAVVAIALLLLAAAIGYFFYAALVPNNRGQAAATPESKDAVDRYFANQNLVVWWDREALSGRPTTVLAEEAVRVASQSTVGAQSSQLPTNIHPDDYAGPQACKKCHEKNFEAWSEHSHRWMNTLATPETIRGDFSGVSISCLGGTAEFTKSDDGTCEMILDRDGIRRQYAITQTIGWRFFQYYVGKLKVGPEPKAHLAYEVDHVLPFGYWLDRKEWVPAVHIGFRSESPDGLREDPFVKSLPQPHSPYFQCNSCHTTFAMGDELTRNFYALGRHAPYPLHWNMPGYLGEARPELLVGDAEPRQVSNQQVESLLIGIQQFEAPDHAITLGVSCEACHFGCKAHADGQQEKPAFFPISPHLNADVPVLPTGRDKVNVNWACGRCHAGERPYFDGGMATWNSTEYTDATKGGCYSKLTCIDCHDPHESIGSKWKKTATEDDQSCLKCHAEYRSEATLTAHTHHPASSEGSRCMNCHMPRINEGLQDVVRTHTIFSPTKAAMIEGNQPNACNICHVEKPIDWTLGYLKDWYKASYDETKLRANYPLRPGPTAVGWLKHKNEAVRLSATDAVGRSDDTTTLPALIDVLDDAYLLNRQFARIALEKRFDLRLEDDGYRFYMSPEERKEPINKIRKRILGLTHE